MMGSAGGLGGGRDAVEDLNRILRKKKRKRLATMQSM